MVIVFFLFSFSEILVKIGCHPLCFTNFQIFFLSYVNFWMFVVELGPLIITWYSILEWCNLCLCYSATFIFSCCKVMDNPHYFIVNIHVIIIASSFFVSTPLGPIFLDFPFIQSKGSSLGCSMTYQPSLRNVSFF